MNQYSRRVSYDKREVRFSFRGEFSGLQAFEQIHDSLPQADSCDRVILDLSTVARIDPIEMLYLLEDLKADSCFNDIEICIQGLQFDRVDMACPYSDGNRHEVHADYGAYERIRMQ